MGGRLNLGESDMGAKEVRLTSGSVNPRLAGKALRRKHEAEFNDADHLMPEDRLSKKQKKRKYSLHVVRLNGSREGWILTCKCGWKSKPSKRGGPLLAAAKELHPAAFQ